MKCPICNSKNVMEIDFQPYKMKIKRSYECGECLTCYDTIESVINDSMPEFVREQVGMRCGDILITKKQLKDAEKLGISSRAVQQRIMSYGFDLEKALSKPAKRRKRKI